jgi:hypothetical protein
MHHKWLWITVVLLLLVHHDFWWWNSREVLLGFLPIGLAYHMGYSIAVALLWLLALKFAWPGELEEWAGAPVSEPPPRNLE